MEARRIAAFLDATTLTPVAGASGRFVCELNDQWLAPTIPFGGLMSSVAVRALHAGAGYASAEIELWDEDRRLVAYATQMMFLSFPRS